MQNKINTCRSIMQEVAHNKNAVIENEREASRNNVFFTSYKLFAEAAQSYLIVQKHFGFHASAIIFYFVGDSPDFSDTESHESAKVQGFGSKMYRCAQKRVDRDQCKLCDANP